MNGTQRKLALGIAMGFVAIVLIVMVANATSTLSDLRRAGRLVRPDLVWSWEWTSIIALFTLYPLLWLAVKWIRPPRFSWLAVAAFMVLGSIVMSAWHIGVMVALRHVYYWAVGSGPYHFFDPGEARLDRILYEYRKDLPTFLQFVVIAAVAQWLIARAATPPAEGPKTLAVTDGAVTHHVPAGEIESIAAAGNYVEIAWLGRTLLHRATLSAVADELGDAFVRIHRGRLVRRDAIRRIETDKSGDFTVELASGATLRGSRRYRPAG